MAIEYFLFVLGFYHLKEIIDDNEIFVSRKQIYSDEIFYFTSGQFKQKA